MSRKNVPRDFGNHTFLFEVHFEALRSFESGQEEEHMLGKRNRDLSLMLVSLLLQLNYFVPPGERLPDETRKLSGE